MDLKQKLKFNLAITVPFAIGLFAIGLFAIGLVLVGCSKPPERTNAGNEVTESGQQLDQKLRTPENQPRQKAEAGVGKRGQKLKDHNGALATPAKAFFRAKQQLIFMNVKRALDLHEIQFGFPKTHEEYMEKIIRANNIQLPELHEGQYYEYDPQTHELMVIGSREEG